MESRIIREDRLLKREISLLRKWCYLKLKELLKDDTESQATLEEANQRFVEKGY